MEQQIAQNPQDAPQAQAAQQPEGGQQKELGPDQQREVQTFVGGITKLLHGKETKGKVYDMLKSAPPEKSIPEAVFHVNVRIAEKMKQKGKMPSMEALFTGTLFATAELAEIANAGKFFKQEINEQNIKPVVQASLQKMVEEGVRRKMIDPVEFQAAVEEMLSPQQRQAGLAAGQKTGVSPEAGHGQAMEQYAAKAVEKDRSMIANQQSVKNRQGAMQQAAQGGQ